MKEIRDEYGFAPQGCLRADLVELLSKSLEGDSLLYSHKMTNIQQDAHKVYLEFNQNGRLVEHDFDLVIGADGIHSQVAQQLEIDPSPPVYSGANIFYGRIPNPDSVEFQHASLQDLDCKVSL
jgi:2-polyprenyl-6-methoxyphenol hydroxylase-like FAD-dependent oxidoreductase